jgi:hypothetical protein
MGNVSTRIFFALFTGYKVKDTQTGLRFIPRKQAGFFIRVPYDRFDYEFAALIDATAEFRGRMLQVPIQTVYIEGNASSHYRAFRDSLTVCRGFLRFLGLSISTAVLDYVTFIAVFYATHMLLVSFIAARTLSVLYNFNFGRALVFKMKNDYARQFIKYIILVLVFMGISYGFTWYVSDRYHGYVVLAKLLSEGTLFLLGFTVQRRFIMVNRKSEIA